MSNGRDDTLRQGLGEIGDVVEVLANLPSEEQDFAMRIGKLGADLFAMLQCEGGPAVVDALFCSCRNQALMETGYLWTSGSKDGPERTYQGGEAARTTIAKLIGVYVEE